MIKLQNPNIPAPTNAIEIDRAIYKTQLKLDSNLNWLSHSYGRAYRFMKKQDKRFYYPEVYIGGDDYFRVTPDNKKSGTCFFVVSREENYDFDNNHFNYLRWEVGIIFNVNLKLINKSLLDNEIFTQNLIKDVREVLTRKMGGLGFHITISNVVREYREIYREFALDEENEYLRAPLQAFRFNCRITMQEDCGNVMFDPCKAVKDNLSNAEKVCVLQSIPFDNDYFFNSLTEQQKIDLLTKLQE